MPVQQHYRDDDGVNDNNAMNPPTILWFNNTIQQQPAKRTTSCRDQRVPILPSIHPNGTWYHRRLSSNNNVDDDQTSGMLWTWCQNAGNNSTSSCYETRLEDTASEKNISSRASSVLGDRNISLVFYGSSHIRELYLAMVRAVHGLPGNAKLSHDLTYIASGERYRSRACDPARRGWVSGKLGVDLPACGLPGRRRILELGHDDVAIGFKTFLHTPDADEQFLHFLKATSPRLGRPQIVVVDVGIWGPRGDKMGGTANYTMTPQEEMDYYLHWIEYAFSTSIILYIHEKLSNSFLSENVLPNIQKLSSFHQGRWVIVRKDMLQQNKPDRMPCGHGCSGPVLHTLAQLILEWLQQYSATNQNCVVP